MSKKNIYELRNFKTPGEQIRKRTKIKYLKKIYINKYIIEKNK